MRKGPKPNDPFKPNWKERVEIFGKWLKRNFTGRTVEIIALLLTVIISFFALRESHKSSRLTEESLKLTQENIKESGRQLDLLNQPFLQIRETGWERTFSDSFPTKFKFILQNHGKFPIKLLTICIESDVEIDPPDIDSVLSIKDIPEAEYVFEESQEKYVDIPSSPERTKTFDQDINKIIESVKNGEKNIYIYGYFKFLSLLNKKTYRYSFIMNYNFDGMIFEHNENELISL